jgi:hypothetical protein
VKVRPAPLVAATIVALLCAARVAPAAAQGIQNGRVAIEAVASVSNSSRAADDPFVFLDLTTTTRVNESLDVIIRPYVRRLPGGDWDGLLYQAEIRYQPIERFRVEAGILSSPIGMGTLELRQDMNPAVASVFYYFGPLPPFDRQADRVQVLSGGYPIGVMLSSSGGWWDVRGGVTDGTPARYRKVFAANNPSPAAQIIGGGGVTLRPGLRFGVGLAHGAYRDADDTDYYNTSNPTALPDANATVFNVEGEYAVRYTRLTGEWVRDRFDSTTGPAITRGFYVQGVQTLTPRIFAAGRITQVSSPVLRGDQRVRSTRGAFELSAGYRLTADWTVKGGYEASRRFGAVTWTHAATASVVWAKRWF